ncbi:hypothetical protein Efla_001895 [Eimeria flavescens]
MVQKKLAEERHDALQQAINNFNVLHLSTHHGLTTQAKQDLPSQKITPGPTIGLLAKPSSTVQPSGSDREGGRKQIAPSVEPRTSFGDRDPQNSSQSGQLPLYIQMESAGKSLQLSGKQHLWFHSFRWMLLERVLLASAAGATDLFDRQEVRTLKAGAFNVARQLKDMLCIYHVEISSWPVELQLMCPSLGSILHDKGFCKPCSSSVLFVTEQ